MEDVVVTLQEQEPSEEQCKVAAYEIWEERGSIDPDPMTVDNYLLAESILKTGETDVKLAVHKFWNKEPCI